MKTKIILTSLFLSLVAISAITIVEILQYGSLKNPFSLKKVSAEAPGDYYSYTYNCECGYTVPSGCDGTPTKATCTAKQGTHCSTGFDCTMIFFTPCNGSSQQACDAPN